MGILASVAQTLQNPSKVKPTYVPAGKTKVTLISMLRRVRSWTDLDCNVCSTFTPGPAGTYQDISRFFSPFATYMRDPQSKLTKVEAKVMLGTILVSMCSSEGDRGSTVLAHQ